MGGASIAIAAPAVLVIPASSDGTFDVLKIGLTLSLLILSLGIHEAAHAWAALKCGDPTARDLGRLTLNPIPHIDLWMSILIPGMFLLMSGGSWVFGGAKPVPVDMRRLKGGLRDMSIVAFAGPLSNLLLVGVFYLLWRLFVDTGYYNGSAPTASARTRDLLPIVMESAMFTNALLFVFNLIPVPPLDGSRIMTWLMPAGLRESYNAIGGFGIVIVLLLMRWDAFSHEVSRLTNMIVNGAVQVVTFGGVW